MRIELNFSLNADDIAGFQRRAPKITKALVPKKPYRFLWMVVFALAIFASVFLIFLTHFNEAVAPAPAASMPAHPSTNKLLDLWPYILLGVFVWFFFLRRLWPRSKALAKKTLKNNPSLAGPQRVTLADEGMFMELPTSRSSMLWAHFIHFAETQGLFVLWMTHQVAHILPKRAFATSAEIDEFRGFAQAHVGNQSIDFPVQPPRPPESNTSSSNVETEKERA